MLRKLLCMTLFIIMLCGMTAFSQEIDLIEKAGQAKWENTEKKNIIFGRDQGADGTVKYETDMVLEDGKKYAKVLFTHPQWKKNGTIIGGFDNITVPEKDPKMIVGGGFNQGAAGTDGVSFSVRFIETDVAASQTARRVRREDLPSGSVLHSIGSFAARYDSRIDRLEYSLANFAGKTGTFVIMVAAGNTADKDWAVWTELKITGGDKPAEKPQAKPTGKLPRELKANLKGHGNRIYFAEFSRNGKMLVTAAGDNTARVWQVPSGKQVSVLRGHGAHVFMASFSANNRRVVTASGDRTARIWQVASGAQLQQLQGHTKQVTAAAFSPNGAQVVTGSDDGTIKIWQAGNGQELKTISFDGGGVYRVIYSPNGRLFAAGGTSGKLALYNVNTGRKTVTLSGHKRAIFSLDFSKNGRWMVTSSLDDTVKVWNAGNGNMVRNFGGRDFYSACFSPNEQYIITGNNGNANIWKIASGEKVMTLKHFSPVPVRGIAVSPNGYFIAMGGDDNIGRIWQVDGKKE